MSASLPFWQGRDYLVLWWAPHLLITWHNPRCKDPDCETARDVWGYDCRADSIYVAGFGLEMTYVRSTP